MGLCLLFGFPSAVGMRTGLVLAQGGEFGLALVTVAITNGLLETNVVQIVLAVVIISMAMTPILIGHNEKICNLLGVGDTNEKPD